MRKLAQIIGLVVIVAVTVLLMAFLFALPTMWLWNLLMPEIFGLNTIDFWQALGINLLAGILFKSSVKSSKD